MMKYNKIIAMSGLLTNLIFSSQNVLNRPSTKANGVFEKPAVMSAHPYSGLRTKLSENGTYKVEYDYNSAGTIKSLAFFENGEPSFFLSDIEARALDISNTGILLLTQINGQTEAPSQFTFYSSRGNRLMVKSVERPEVSRFSSQGDLFGIMTSKELEVVDPKNFTSQKYRGGKKFDISDDGSVVAVAYEGGVVIYRNGDLIDDQKTGFIYNRDIRISPDKQRVAVADIQNLKVYDINKKSLFYSEKIAHKNSIRELRLDNNRLWMGIKFEDTKERRGILKTIEFDVNGTNVYEEIQSQEELKRSGYIPSSEGLLKKTPDRPPSIPWPFAPQDEPHFVWNNYEGLNNSADGQFLDGYPYLHQGVDIEVPANTPVYSVDTGIVKYHGDLGGSGALYWRIAVSPQQTAGYSNGWLYAHLIESTINYAVGDRVPSVGLHLGDIVAWPGGVVAGHLHFAEIRDHGNVWSYTDDEWGITYNPELSLTPYPDTTAPIILSALSGKSKFCYLPNNSGYGTQESNYLFPDSARGGVRGDIDISVNLYDYIVYENFTQPAFAIYYSIKGIDPSNSNYNKLIVDTTLAQIRNHSYDKYGHANYKPASQILYQVDSVFQAGGWFNRTRTFTHVLTNNNGDSILTIGEADSALHTAEYWDGWYRVSVEVYDAAGNVAHDSEDVYFNNGNVDTSQVRLIEKTGSGVPMIELFSSFVRYQVKHTSLVELSLYSPSGRQRAVLVSGVQEPGLYKKNWTDLALDNGSLESGLYILTLSVGKASTIRKFVYSP